MPGRRGHGRKHTDDEVMALRALWRSGASIEAVAATAGMSSQQVRLLLYGETYREVPGAITRSERVARYGLRGRG